MTNSDREALGQRLKNAREYLGLSQDEVSSLLEVPRSAISLAESGKRRVDAIELQKLSKIYRKSISELAGEGREEAPISEHLARAATGLTENDQNELLEFARFLKSRSKSQQDE